MNYCGTTGDRIGERDPLPKIENRHGIVLDVVKRKCLRCSFWFIAGKNYYVCDPCKGSEEFRHASAYEW